MWSMPQAGKIKYTERYKDANGKYKTVSITFPKDTAHNRKEAQKLLNFRINNLSKEKTHGITIEEAAEAYQSYQKAHVRESTYRRNKIALNAIIRYFEGIRLNDITAAFVRDHLPDDTPELFNENLKRFKAFIRWCYDSDLIDEVDFLTKLKPLKTAYKEKISEKYLEKDELRILADSMEKDEYRLLTLFLALTGLRIGEVLALVNADVDIINRNIHVNKTYNLQMRKVLPFTKTEASTRDIYIQGELLPIVEQMQAIHPKKQKEFIRVEYAAYRKYMRLRSERLLKRRITPHALRHTMTSLFAAEGIPLEVISRRLGHSDSEITKAVYFHVTEGLKDRDARLIERVKIL